VVCGFQVFITNLHTTAEVLHNAGTNGTGVTTMQNFTCYLAGSEWEGFESWYLPGTFYIQRAIPASTWWYWM